MRATCKEDVSGVIGRGGIYGKRGFCTWAGSVVVSRRLEPARVLGVEAMAACNLNGSTKEA